MLKFSPGLTQAMPKKFFSGGARQSRAAAELPRYLSLYLTTARPRPLFKTTTPRVRTFTHARIISKVTITPRASRLARPNRLTLRVLTPKRPNSAPAAESPAAPHNRFKPSKPA